MRCSNQRWNGCVPPPAISMLSRSPALTSVSRICCSWLSSGPCSRWMSVAISIMLCVISGVTTPGNGLRRNSSSKSLALLERSRS
ncbi:hypothetical protein D9M68_837550 [compost metagenome]